MSTLAGCHGPVWLDATARDPLDRCAAADAQNTKDDLVAPAVTDAHVRALCRSGNRVRRIAINGSGHATSAKDSATETLDWIATLFAGQPTRDDCAR